VNPDAYIGIRHVDDEEMQPPICKACGLFRKWWELPSVAEFTAQQTRNGMSIPEADKRMAKLKQVNEKLYKEQLETYKLMNEDSNDPRQRRQFVRGLGKQRVALDRLSPVHGIEPPKLCAVLKNKELAVIPGIGVSKYASHDSPVFVGDGHHRATARVLIAGPKWKKTPERLRSMDMNRIATSRADDILGNLAARQDRIKGVTPERTFEGLIERDLLGKVPCVTLSMHVPKLRIKS
jgi:hypothetical protein